jgi:hypothetical protein
MDSVDFVQGVAWQGYYDLITRGAPLTGQSRNRYGSSHVVHTCGGGQGKVLVGGIVTVSLFHAKAVLAPHRETFCSKE